MTGRPAYSIGKSICQFSSGKGQRQIGLQSSRVLEIIRRAEKEGSIPEKFQSIIRAAYRDLAIPAEAVDHFAIGAYEVAELQQLSDDNVLRYVYHRYRYKMFPEQKRLDEFPPCLQIEPTSKCNFRCIFCYQSDKSFSRVSGRHAGAMTLGMFKDVIDQAANNVDFITLASRGEPLLSKQIIPMLEYMKGKFLTIKLNTNASLLTADVAHAILSSGVTTIVFSVDAADDALYRAYRVNGDLRKVLANIRKFKEIKDTQYASSPIITRVSGVLIDERRQKMKDMRACWGDVVDQVSFVKYSPWERLYDAPVNDIAAPCSDLWRRTFVWFDGTVNPCDSDYKSMLSVGILGRQTLSGIWRGPAYESLRKRHLMSQRRRIEPCMRCSVV